MSGLMSANFDVLAREKGANLTRGQMTADGVLIGAKALSIGGDMLSAWAQYGAAKASAAMQSAQADAIAMTAGGYTRDAREHRRMAGEAQLEGNDAIALRNLQLGQDVSRVYAGAAGAGLGMDSRIVRHVDRAVRLNARRDTTAIAHNSRESAAAHMSQALASEYGWINQMLSSRMAKVNARYQRRAARGAYIGSLISGAGRLALIGGGAAIGGGLAGGQGALAGGAVASSI